MAAAAAAASDAVLESSVLATLEVVPSSPGAGWSHFRLEGFGGSAEDIFLVLCRGFCVETFEWLKPIVEVCLLPVEQ